MTKYAYFCDRCKARVENHNELSLITFHAILPANTADESVELCFKCLMRLKEFVKGESK